MPVTQAQRNRFEKAKKAVLRLKNKKTIKSVVNREINKRVETKHMKPIQNLGNRITNYFVDPVTQCIPLVPQLAQSSGQGDRNGNRVRTKKSMVTITCSVDQLTTSSGYVPPVYIDIYIYKVRKTNNQSAITVSEFLQDGNGTTTYDSSVNQFSGNYPINKDRFVLKKKKRILLWNQPMVSNDFTVNPSSINNCKDLINARTISFDITKCLKKNMDFQDAVTNTPEDNLYISCFFTPNDYQTAYLQNFVTGQFDVMHTYSYDDM